MPKRRPDVPGCDMNGFTTPICTNCAKPLAHVQGQILDGHHIHCHKDAKISAQDREIAALKGQHEALKAQHEAQHEDHEILKMKCDFMEKNLELLVNEKIKEVMKSRKQVPGPSKVANPADTDPLVTLSCDISPLAFEMSEAGSLPSISIENLDDDPHTESIEMGMDLEHQAQQSPQ